MATGRNGNEHIDEVKWRNPDDGKTGASSREVMVDWIKNKGGVARVADTQDPSRVVTVGVVEADPPYLRTHADGKWTDNLLALPRY